MRFRQTANIIDMAVYTSLTEGDVRDFLSAYAVGELVSFEGIAEGITNTNYVVLTTENKFILTLFENHFKLEELPYFVELMQWWSARGIDCPTPIQTKDGRTLMALKERPALMVSFLEGEGVKKISTDHLSQVGMLVGQMHIAGMDFPYHRPNALSVAGWELMVDQLEDRADEIEQGLQQTIVDEVNYLAEHWPTTLPAGAVHVDLFPDNIFFYKAFGKSPKLTGVIDCYFACHDMWAYDLAIVVNAWCFDDRHRLVPERVQALMAGYNDIRPLSAEEEAAFPVLLRGAAMRFLLTRALDWLNPQQAETLARKDPLEYAAKLHYFQTQKL